MDEELRAYFEQQLAGRLGAPVTVQSAGRHVIVALGDAISFRVEREGQWSQTIAWAVAAQLEHTFREINKVGVRFR